MSVYAITWQPRSGVETELQSDTIFGHICWSILQQDGKAELEEFIKDVKAKRSFVCSSAFPKNYLPLPYIPFDDDASKALKSLKRADVAVKSLKKYKWLKYDVWSELVSKYNYDIVLQKVFQELATTDFQKNLKETLKLQDVLTAYKPETQTVLHATIDRISGTTGESGNLFASHESYYPEAISLWSFIETDMPLEKVKRIFSYISATGFGKNKNTGKGWFHITVEPFEFPTPKIINASLNLSEMVPAATDATNAYYELNTKFGKVGGNFAVSESPFKYAIIQMKPGAVFVGENALLGMLIESVHPDRPEVIQNCYSFSIPFYWEEQHEL